jgi:Major capsid protein N-terminus
VTATISRNGDLIFRTYLQVKLPDVSVPNNTAFRWVNWLGHALISTVEVEIGGQRINVSAKERSCRAETLVNSKFATLLNCGEILRHPSVPQLDLGDPQRRLLQSTVQRLNNSGVFSRSLKI